MRWTLLSRLAFGRSSEGSPAAVAASLGDSHLGGLRRSGLAPPL